ncbi:MAG: methyltransferase domain-containing protein [Ignavibacteriaceae bacterium]|nr:methyltransferase domain-containing protein [Ignavibacteriaceae bacterium]
MIGYLNNKFNVNDPSFISSLDEAPLWSVPFGLKIFERVRFRQNIRALDVGCGTGYPLIELAESLGGTCEVFGFDPWKEALDRAKEKIMARQITNIKLLPGFAEELPFDKDYFHLIVSNNGLNNVDDVDKSLSEIHRVLKGKGQLVITINLPGTMHEFYDAFKSVLKNHGMTEEIAKTEEHILQKRKPLVSWIKLMRNSGFEVTEVSEDKFRYHYTNGSAMLNHSFIRLAFLEPWIKLLPAGRVETVFGETEQMLNEQSKNKGMILTIPFACIDCRPM